MNKRLPMYRPLNKMLFSLASFLAFCSPTITFNTIGVFTYLKGTQIFLVENPFHRLVFQFWDLATAWRWKIMNMFISAVFVNVYIQWNICGVPRSFLCQRNVSWYALKECCDLREMQLSYGETTLKNLPQQKPDTLQGASPHCHTYTELWEPWCAMTN